MKRTREFYIYTYEDKDMQNEIKKERAVRKTENGYSNYANKMYKKYYEKYEDLTVVVYEYHKEFHQLVCVGVYHA